MRPFTVLVTTALAFLASPVTARAAPSPKTLTPRDACLCPDDAAYLVNSFAILINSTFNPALATDILATDFTDYSDSIDFLAGIPLGSPTFTSLAAYIAGQGSQPAIPFEIIAIDAVTCDVIAYRWVAQPGAGSVKGITIAYVTQGTGSANGFQIETQYVEFDVAEWIVDIGGTCVPPPPPTM